MYQIIPQHIPKDKRAEINEKILFCIDTGKSDISPEVIYNTYTGLGGLHKFTRSDYPNYHAFAEAKKEFELGQFFTPHDLCKTMVGLINPKPEEMVLDMCCGMGNFFNFMPNQHNLYGCDIDSNAIKIASHLYPDAHLETCDLHRFRPAQRFDLIIGNPPFNTKIDGITAQDYYTMKAANLLKPAGLFMFIVPVSFMDSETWEKSRITGMNDDFSFIGQTELQSDTFKSVGVENFRTKIMVFMRNSVHIEHTDYSDTAFLTLTELKKEIDLIKQKKERLRILIAREAQRMDQDEMERFEYLYKKYLFEIKQHKQLRKHYDKSVALITKFRNQSPPENCTHLEYNEWEKKKLTTDKVLRQLYRTIKNQNYVPRKEIALVKTSYGFKLKRYSAAISYGTAHRNASINDLIREAATLPMPGTVTEINAKQIKAAERFIRRKKKQYENQSIPFSEMDRNPAVDKYLSAASFISPKDRSVCKFNDLQKYDLGRVMQKRYAILNWQQGSGKTAASFHFAERLLRAGKIRNVFVLAPANATNMTWDNFLTLNGCPYHVLRTRDDVLSAPRDAYLVVSISMLDKLKKPLMKLVKLLSRKACLLFDECDEITNPNSARTQQTLAIFRRLRYKILASGTTTRNNITEQYSQLELLYNNSINMLCSCETVYHQNREKEIEANTNKYFELPYPAYNGSALFKACFCPGKATVFGTEKQNQDIYNKDHLWEIIAKTIITRKFKEFAADKYEIRTHSVKPHLGEFAVFKIITDEFCRICEKFYNSTGDSRKDASLRLMRQLKLLIRACSEPNFFEGYFGAEYPTKTTFIGDMIRKIHGKVAVGCTTLRTLDMYCDFLTEKFPEREIFIIRGDISFSKRLSIIKKFEATEDGILICTQQSLKSSVNIPSCNEVIIESLQWNIPKTEQFYFRFIRLDAEYNTTVHFINYLDSIEQNLMALVLTKERLNEFIKTGQVMQQSEIFEEFDVNQSFIDSLLIREQDHEGKFHIRWGTQRISA